MADDAKVIVTRFDGLTDELCCLAYNHDIASEMAQSVIARASHTIIRMAHLIEELLDAYEHGDECHDECTCMWPLRAVEWEIIQQQARRG